VTGLGIYSMKKLCIQTQLHGDKIYLRYIENFIQLRKLVVVKVVILIYNGKKIQGYCLPEIFQCEQ
jgi:hypothetical protein